MAKRGKKSASSSKPAAAADAPLASEGDPLAVIAAGAEQEAPSEPSQEEMRVAKATRAAADCYIQVAHEIGVIPELAGDELDTLPFPAAAGFLLDHADADAAAIPIHLHLKKLGGSMEPTAQDIVPWNVFADTFRRVHRYLVDVDEAAAQKPAAEAGGLPLEPAFKPEPGPFDGAGGLSALA